MTVVEADRAAIAELERLTRDELVDAIHNMKVMGFGDESIARATHLSVEAVRQFLAERRERAS